MNQINSLYILRIKKKKKKNEDNDNVRSEEYSYGVCTIDSFIYFFRLSYF